MQILQAGGICRTVAPSLAQGRTDVYVGNKPPGTIHRSEEKDLAFLNLQGWDSRFKTGLHPSQRDIWVTVIMTTI